jgi:D-alanyl-D-alanine dipeptidase
MVTVSKIRKRVNTWPLLAVFLTQIPVTDLAAQDTASNRPLVTQKLQVYKRQVKDDPSKEMVELKSVALNIIYDLRYATVNNFMHRLMYPENTDVTFLRRPVADSLVKVLVELGNKGIGLKIFDAYRPYSVTVKFWELIHDERYVANPARGSGHNRGTAVDLTLISLKDSTELDMGTGFDNFTDSAHHSFTGLSPLIMANRNLLKSTMEKYGFKAFGTEWWHYYISNQSQYEVLDIPFRKLKKTVHKTKTIEDL